MAVTVLEGTDGVRAAVGRHLGWSPWVTVDQARIDMFAAATGDHQWIHTDPERAASGPFGTTIAHGYLTLALTNHLLPQIVEVRGISAGLNYGVDRVRFPEPVPAGARVRAGAELTAVAEVHGGVQATVEITVERDGGERPVCVVSALNRYLD